MSVRDILIHPEPRLRKVAAVVPAVDDGIMALAGDMLDTMY
jgi:peptide deformylase